MAFPLLEAKLQILITQSVNQSQNQPIIRFSFLETHYSSSVLWARQWFLLSWKEEKDGGKRHLKSVNFTLIPINVLCIFPDWLFQWTDLAFSLTCTSKNAIGTHWTFHCYASSSHLTKMISKTSVLFEICTCSLMLSIDVFKLHTPGKIYSVPRWSQDHFNIKET